MKEMKRILSLFLCLVMLVGYIPVGALAAEGESATEPSETVVETTEAVVETTETVVETTETVVETTETVVETTEETVPETTAPKRKPVMMGASKKEAASQVTSNSKADIDYLFLATDRHGNTSVIGSLIDSMESAIGENELDYLGLGGGMDSDAAYNSSAVLKEATGATASLSAENVDIVAAIHDMSVTDDAGIVLPYQGGGAQIFEGNKFYVYGVEESCISADSAAEAQKFVDWANGSDIDKTKAVIVLSHYPLHVRGNDNAGAADWAAALNTVAAGADSVIDRNVAFFWGHNHADESEQDTSVYYVAPNGSISVQGGSSSQNIYFTYANAGYLNDKNSATLVTITEDTITFAKYVGSSVSTTNSVARVAPSAEPEVPQETAPAEPEVTELKVVYSKETLAGDTLALQVLAVYSDGTEKELTSEEYQMATSYGRNADDAQVYVVSYGEQSHSFLVGRDAATGVAVVADEMEELTVTDVTNDEAVIAAVADTFTGAFAAYDITPNKYNTENSPAVVSMPAPEGANAVFHWNQETDELEPVEDALFENGKVIFTTDHFSTYTVGNVKISEEPSNNVALGGMVPVTKTIYKRATSISANKAYLIVNSNATGEAVALANNNGSVAATPVTIGRDTDNNICIVLDDAADELWTTSAAIGQTTSSNLKNGSYYLQISENGTLGLATSTGNYTNWRYNTQNQLFRYRRYYEGRYPNFVEVTDTDYLQYGNGWSSTENSDYATSVYFYEATTGTVMESSTITYTMRAANVTQVDPLTNKTAKIDFCLQGNGEDLTTLPAGGSYSFSITEKNAEAPIITSIGNDGTITFTGAEGEAAVKVAYTWTDDAGEHVVYKYINVKVVAPYYSVEITEGVADKDGNVTYTVVPSGKILAKKEVTSATQLLLGTDGGLKCIDDANLEDDAVDKTTYKLVWTSSNEKVAIVDQNGKVSFKDISENGTTQITVTAYAVDETGAVTETVLAKDMVTVTASPNAYYTPEDGKEQMPDYPGAGAVVIDKNAKAVGNFNETGIAQVELSMFGVPAGGKPVDVIMVVDKSVSMDENNRSANAETAAKAFVDTLKSNPENRLAIVTYSNENDGVLGPVIFDLQELTPENVTKAYTQINTFSEGTKQATNYVSGLSSAQSILNGIQNDRQKFVVFLSDGAPSKFKTVDGGTYDLTDGVGGPTSYWISDDNKRNDGVDESSSGNWWETNNEKNWRYEYYTTQMKKAGVTVYTVGLGLSATQPKLVLNDMSGPAGETEQQDKPGTGTTSKKNKYYFEVADDNAATELSRVFANIASEIAAASDVTVKDLVTKDYSVIFQMPSALEGKNVLPDGQEFYLEVVKYPLNEEHKRTGTPTTLQRIYLDGTKVCVKNADGTKTPLTETDKTEKLGDDEVHYYDDHTAQYPHFKTKHFEYSAQGGVDKDGNKVAKLDWNADTLSDDFDMAIRYFVYLDGSVEQKLESGPYSTNVEATISYTNHLGNLCTQKFPVPQMTWNGAQVSYVFYLVNDDGTPINQSGVETDFRTAVFVTDIFTEHVTWNDAEGITSLKVNTIASTKLPEGYVLYDPAAEYNLHVYEKTGYYEIDPDTGEKDFIGTNEPETFDGAQFNWFEIIAGEELENRNTTKVYSSLSGTHYDDKGVYTNDAKVKSIVYKDADENGLPLTKNVDFNGITDVDIYSTTVAFAVKWTHKVMDDTVVVDYGLPVKINVVENDLLQNQIHGIGLNAPAATNSIYDVSAFGQRIEVPGVYTAVNDNTFVTFTQDSMEFKTPAEFYYDTQVAYTENGTPKSGYMCAKVTVIPATTIYYEDTFVKYTNSKNAADGFGEWVDANENYADAPDKTTQNQDRPGPSQISKDLDADNVYGYDSNYSEMTTYSLGSAKKVSVKQDVSGMAEFEFYGTGFDVISMTDNTTGTIVVRVYDGTKMVYNGTVDTFYGYTYDGGEWVASDNGSLYQVPVIKVTDLPYGPKYRAQIVATYGSALDHVEDSTSYDFYLDAIRIYDPTGNQNDIANGAYVKDGEGWPIYEELRNNVIKASDFWDGVVNGMVFVDGVGETVELADYIGYGPNNELYLSGGQMVAFALDLTGYGAEVAKVQLGAKSADGNPLKYAVLDADKITENFDLEGAASRELKTATDMYYDITDLKDKTIVIYNSSNSDGILSLTDIKVTFKTAPTIVDRDLFYTNVATIMNIMKNLQTVRPEQPEENPESTVLDVTAELPETVRAGVTFDVKVTAPEADTVNVRVGDVVVAATETIDDGVWLAKLTAGDAGTMKVTIVASALDEDGNKVKAEVNAEVTVYASTYEPKKFEVSPAEANAGRPVRITVTTSSDVAAVRIGGTLVTSYTVSENDRVWSLTMTFDEVPKEQKLELQVIGYSVGGQEFEKIHEITVAPATRTLAQTVKNVVSSIAKTLMSWFKK